MLLNEFTERPEIFFSLSLDRCQEIESQMDRDFIFLIGEKVKVVGTLAEAKGVKTITATEFEEIE
jgi:uncharacterized Zn finger protein